MPIYCISWRRWAASTAAVCRSNIVMPPAALQRMMKISIWPYAKCVCDVTALGLPNLISDATANLIPSPPLGCYVVYCGHACDSYD